MRGFGLVLAALAGLILGLGGLLAATTTADAKAYRAGVHGFRTATCKTATCRSRHPSGRYVHPLTHRRR
jgi:hypothetical protein